MLDDETKYSIKEVIEFCHECEIQIIGRDKTRHFLYESGKTIDDLIDEIRSLRIEHQCCDPELDYSPNHKGYVYQFKKVSFDKYWCYIKIKIKREKERIVAVLSFHKQEDSGS